MIARTVTVGLVILSCTLFSPAYAHEGPLVPDAPQLRAKLLDWVNEARIDNGLHSLKVSSLATKLARNHTLAMAARHQLFHTPNLGDLLRPVNPSIWGENVGVGPTARAIFRAYMNSPTHRANILHRGFSHIGVWFVKHGGAWWNTMIFYG